MENTESIAAEWYEAHGTLKRHTFLKKKKKKSLFSICREQHLKIAPLKKNAVFLQHKLQMKQIW